MSSSDETLLCCCSEDEDVDALVADEPPGDFECSLANDSSDEEQLELSGSGDDTSEEGVAVSETGSASVAPEHRVHKRSFARGQPEGRPRGHKRPRVEIPREHRVHKRSLARGQPEGRPRNHKRPRVEIPRPAGELAEPQSLFECFEWPAKAFRIAQEAGIDIYERLGRRTWTLSSHFSGLGTVEVALQMLQNSFPPQARSRLQGEVISACEISPALQEGLRQRFAGCIFGDITGLTDFTAPRNLASQPSLAQMADIARDIARAKLVPTSRCFQQFHGTGCRPRGADIDVSGTPCQPWSRMTHCNRRATKGLAHKHARPLIAWCAMLLATRTPVAIHENVKGFRESILRSLLGQRYDITALHVEPAQVGFPFIRRPRWYHVLCRRGIVSTPSLAEIYAILSAGLKKRSPPEWPAWVFQATEAEILEAENRARRKQKLESVSVASSDWRYLLTDLQAEYIDRYTEMVAGQARDVDSLVFNLSQTPRFNGFCAAGTGCQPCGGRALDFGLPPGADGFCQKSWRQRWASLSTQIWQQRPGCLWTRLLRPIRRLWGIRCTLAAWEWCCWP